MPEYLAPGVYVEEVSYRSKSIEGVSTTTTGFVGPTRYGPTTGEPPLLTSFTDFERIYGGLDSLIYATDANLTARNTLVNYMAHAVRAFFDNGGRRLYVARTYRPLQGSDGHGRATIPAPSAATEVALRAAVNAVAAGTAAVAAGVNAATQALDSATAARTLATAIQGEAGAALATANAALTAAQTERATAVTDLTTAIDALDAALGGGNAALGAIDEDTATRADILATVDAAIAGNNDPAVVTAREQIVAALDDRDAADTNVTTTQAEVNAATTAQTGAGDVIADADAAITNANTARDLATAPVDVAAKLGGALEAGDTAGRNAALPGDPVVQNADTQAAASAALATDLTQAAVDATASANQARQTAATRQGALAGPGTQAERLGRAAEAVAAAQTAGDEGRDAIQAAVDLAGGATVPLGPAAVAARDSRIAARAAEGAAVARFRARFPGAAGNIRVIVRARPGQNALSRVGGNVQLSQVQSRDLVFLSTVPGRLFVATRANDTWSFVDGANTVTLDSLNPDSGHTVRVITFSVEAEPPGAFAQPQLWDGLSADAAGVLNPRPNDIRQVFAADIPNQTRRLETPLILEPVGNNVPTAGALVASLIGGTGMAALPALTRGFVETVYLLQGGNDGVRPGPAEYVGQSDQTAPPNAPGPDVTSGLAALEGLEEISIVAAPGLSFDASSPDYGDDAAAATQAIIAHCNLMRYRVAVLDSGNDQGITDVRSHRALLDTDRAAFYYPWVQIVDPISREPITVPPSGFVAGIYARNDIDHGVHKAPANEVVVGAIWLETVLSTRQQDILNPLGINCLRYFENRGIRVWGARTLSSDPEWKYLNIRRYFAYLERSIERSTQWAVFEPNGEALWANVRRAVEDFLFNEWKSERLAGAKPGEAFFVKCDRTTMTQNDLDNGRMICLIGVAPLYPAEFVIFRIGQWTADRPV